jgi:HAD superfamily hydrolase (TIGR01509 family)
VAENSLLDGVRAVAFDMDGVLVDSEKVNLGSAFDAFAALGRTLAEDASAVIVGRHPDDYVPDLVERLGLPASHVATIRKLQDRLYRQTWSERVTLNPGAVEALGDIRERGLPTGLATSSSAEHVVRCLERFSLAGLFDAVLTRESVERRKPAPDVYLLCARRLGVDPGALLVIEDSEHGLCAARAAGTRCIAIRTAHTPPDRLVGADLVIDSLEQLRALIR